MKKTFLFIITLLLLVIVVVQCSENEENTIPIEVSDIKLVPLGRISSELVFVTNFENNILNCDITTIRIFKNDTIKYIKVFVLKDNLNIEIKSSPNPFCLDDSCFITQNINFNLIGMKKGKYNVTIGINSLFIPGFKVEF